MTNRFTPSEYEKYQLFANICLVFREFQPCNSKMEAAQNSPNSEAIVALLTRIKVLNDTVIEDVRQFANRPRLVAMARQYEANLSRRDIDIGFNLFELVSDYYYRETFHSDILRALLDPSGKHGEGQIFLQLFLEFLKERNVNVDAANYRNSKVVREEGRVDILIKDEDSKHAVVIENKINNAGDTPQQLPSYLEQVISKGYTCDSIIYLRLTGHAGPDTSTWTENQRNQVMERLLVICVLDDSEADLLNGWVRRCEQACTKHSDVDHVLRQYARILRKLGGNVMNKPLMEDFYKIISQEGNLKTALLLKAMVDDLILYRAERIVDAFKNDLKPFRKVSIYAGNDAYFTDLFWNDAHLGIDIVVEPESYLFQFWDRNDRAGKCSKAKEMLQKMDCLPEFSDKGGEFCKSFAFPTQEAELYRHLREFKKKLAEEVQSD